jgi:hypothetical protein
VSGAIDRFADQRSLGGERPLIGLNAHALGAQQQDLRVFQEHDLVEHTPEQQIERLGLHGH